MQPHTLSLDSDPALIDAADDPKALQDPDHLLLDLLIYGPSANPVAGSDDGRWSAQYAQARVNAYVYLQQRGFGGNPVDPLDIASWVKI